MKLSLVFELLLIFVLLAFAASKSIKKIKRKALADKSGEDKQEDNGINKYCRCSEAYCNCCREFQVPYVNLDGPGCASLMYLDGDKLSVSLSFGKKVITNRTISSKKAAPVCMPMPGGVSKFCGRIYNIARTGEDFRACLGLELQSKSTVEAAVRVSCFKFGPKGVNLEHADPLPLVSDQKAEEDDDDDDDDDDDEEFDLAGVDDDDDDLDVGDDDDDDGDADAANDVESADYTGFSLLDEDILGDLFGSSGGKKPNKNKNKTKNNKQKQAPTSTTTTKRPRPTRRPTTRRPPTVRNTTPRATTVRSTTVRVRPGNRRPTRRPGNRRPGNRRTTTTTVAPIISSSSTEQTTPTPLIRSTERYVYTNAASDQTFEPVVIVTQRPSSMMPTKSVTDFEDSGIEMSLAQLTGQLASMPVTPILSNNNKEEGKMTTALDMNYEKIATVTAKAPTTLSLDMSSEQAVQDDLVQIVQSLESNSDEHKETLVPDETRAFHFVNKDIVVPSEFYSGIVLPKRKPKGEDFEMEDLDVLDLTKIGESVGQQLGIFGKGKNKNKNKNKIKDTDCEDVSSDYTDIGDFGSIDPGFDFADRKNKGRTSRRQNKMMRGDWS